MSQPHYDFDTYLAKQLKNPKFKAAYKKETARISRLHVLMSMHDAAAKETLALYNILMKDEDIRNYAKEINMTPPQTFGE